MNTHGQIDTATRRDGIMATDGKNATAKHLFRQQFRRGKATPVRPGEVSCLGPNIGGLLSRATQNRYFIGFNFLYELNLC